MDEKRFESAKNKIIGIDRERHGIGTLSEKTVHAVLKNYYAPDEDMHEIPIGSFVADIYTGTEIIEIQTRAFNAMRRKLDAFLPLYPVTIVYPIPHVKYLYWIDEVSGEVSAGRKSPKKGSPYHAFVELYKIRPYLSDPNLRLKLVLLDMEEYRLLNGWSRDKKKGSDRYDRIPVQLVEEVCIDRREDYMQFVPADLPEEFTAKDFARCAKIPVRLAQTVLLILTDLEIVSRIGKQGRSILYEIREIP
jgi:hypothetical protein